MTVSELREILAKFDDNNIVSMWCEERECIDICHLEVNDTVVYTDTCCGWL